MNAVRMSHYPPDPHFLDVCDSLGLYVLDELTGWQKSYSTAAGMPLVPELVNRDVNHPSIVLWDNGNEGGWNRALDGECAKYDPQQRTVIHPWENFDGINTGHYESYDCCAGWLFHGDDLIMPTEMIHGLYDGGGGAGSRNGGTRRSPVRWALAASSGRSPTKGSCARTRADGSTSRATWHRMDSSARIARRRRASTRSSASGRRCT